MEDIIVVVKALECLSIGAGCKGEICKYWANMHGQSDCAQTVAKDALETIRSQNQHIWEILIRNEKLQEELFQLRLKLSEGGKQDE